MRFLTEVTFTQAPTPEMLALIPAETAHGLKLDAAGMREHLFVAADNSRAWQVLRADSLAEAEAIAKSFPLAPYLAITITPLAEPQG
ncbi:MAG: hypothetical protein JST60_05425 [Chloroflexi bacterium SZAS-1]|jgi:muconolactone delta-isomerase|nr:hypothetical protein [Chloroflexi bacterium SZAS-1]